MCQAKQIWSNATQHSQRFETVLCKPIRAKQAYAWRPCPWHIRYFRYGFYKPRSKFPRHFFQHCWWSHGQWSFPHSNFTWQATQTEHTTYRTTLPIWQNKWWLTTQHTERQPNQHWHKHNHTRSLYGDAPGKFVTGDPDLKRWPRSSTPDSEFFKRGNKKSITKWRMWKSRIRTRDPMISSPTL